MGPAPGEKTGLPAWQTHALENLPNSCNVASRAGASGQLGSEVPALNLGNVEPANLTETTAF